MKSLGIQGLYSLVITSLLFTMVQALPGTAQTLPRNEFNITLDLNGHIVDTSSNPYSPSTGEIQNTGYGDKWYFYPNSGRYIQWYYNDPYDPERKATLDVWVFIENADPDRQFISEVTYCWARPEWSMKYLNSPPLPIDIPDSNTEHMYIQNRSDPLHTTHGGKQILGRGGSIEPHVTEDIEGYNPEWIGISVSGTNIHVFRWITMQCVIDDSDDGSEPIILGACCNQSTGSCFLSSQMGCINPNLWLGPGTTCSQCQEDATIWDFGDAPVSYPVVISANGARHIKQSGIHLGSGISTESNGQPTPNADGDNYDDGIQFISALIPGSEATVRITASAPGYINAWLDLNRDGDWNDASDRILHNASVIAGASTYTFSVPTTAILGYTYARFRYNTTGGLGLLGEAVDGEVEDYMVQIVQYGGGTDDPQNPTILSYQSPQNKYLPAWSQPAQQIDAEQHILVDTSEASLYKAGPIIADDWEDPTHRPIIGLRWWGTFEGWTELYPPTELPSAFHIGIWTNDVNESTPSTLMWESLTTGWAWTLNGTMASDSDTEGQTVFEFAKLFSQYEWFYPDPNQGSQYWISIAADYETNPLNSWRWMTQSNIQGQYAIQIDETTSPPPNSTDQWPPSIGYIYAQGISLDMDACFELLTVAPGIMGLGGDFNGDGKVDDQDLAAILNLWLNMN